MKTATITYGICCDEGPETTVIECTLLEDAECRAHDGPTHASRMTLATVPPVR